MSVKEQIVKVCHLVYQNKFVAAYDGNISARTENNSLYITRSGICKGDVTIDDIIETDYNGNIISGKGKISTENKLHLYIYKNRKDVNAVVHCHPVYATALGLVEENFLEHYFPEVLLTLGKIPVCKYATPSTKEVTDSINDFITDSNAFILQNHGAVTVGSCVMDAYYKMEKLEHAAETIFVAKAIGNPRKLTKKNIRDLLSISESTYGIKLDINKLL
ncbi:L-fuculose-phosphate aldolase [Ignavibacterium album JCM 16511]|uniref:L-fuculose-phosphate aldolase n=1 Tax=Ignavibacterium album (strain DSM 19864 / JCM 16511 / NBRC 101810 / Mat9-16) TaxID=945713 RepID=I0AHI6_IGNAJ|nr:class II aldolase/adducin family protein [Ignavibacterium album]AFH48443.1 L-fuculose-phosphate aldolase [Ignavibacterium album JCM 16511]